MNTSIKHEKVPSSVGKVMERTRFSLQTDGRTEEQSETSISRPLLVVVVTGGGRGGYFEKLNAWIIGTILLLLVWLNHN